MENSFIDYPGKLSCVVFTYGCNLRCDWCHSPSLVIKPKFLLKKYKDQKIIDFIKEKNKYQKWLDAIVICGGEPTIQKDLIQFLIKIKTELPGILVKLDTNGTNATVLKKILYYNLIDYIAMDIKPRQIGRDKYMECIDIVRNSNIDYEFRMTCYPGEINDENIKDILKNFYYSKTLVLQNFNNKNEMINKKCGSIKPYKNKILENWKKQNEGFFEKIIIR